MTATCHVCSGAGEILPGVVCLHCSGVGTTSYACCWMDAHGETRESLADDDRDDYADAMDRHEEDRAAEREDW